MLVKHSNSTFKLVIYLNQVLHIAAPCKQQCSLYMVEAVVSLSFTLIATISIIVQSFDHATMFGKIMVQYVTRVHVCLCYDPSSKVEFDIVIAAVSLMSQCLIIHIQS